MTYYVDSAIGNNSNNGLSPETAWQNTSKLASFSPAAGDIFLLKRGQTFSGWNVNDGGTLENPVTYGAYGTGDNPIISGQTSVNDRRNVVFQDLVFSGASGEYSAGIFCKPTYQEPQNITLRRCEVKDNGWAGIWFLGEGDMAIDGINIIDCSIHDNTIFGILINGQDSLHLIDNVLLTQSRIFDNGNLTDGQHGVHIEYSNEAVVTNNKIYGNQGHLGWSSGIYFTFSLSSICRYNEVYENDRTNIHYDVYSNDAICEYNVCYGAPEQGIMVEEHFIDAGVSYYRYNTCFENARGFYIGPGTDTQEVSGLVVEHNVFRNNVYSGWGIDGGNGGDIADYLNNVVDENVYSNNHDVGATAEPNNTYDMEGWRTLTGFDLNSVETSPLPMFRN